MFTASCFQSTAVGSRVERKCVGVGLFAELFQQPCRTLDVGEQDGSGRELEPHARIQSWVMTLEVPDERRCDRESRRLRGR